MNIMFNKDYMFYITWLQRAKVAAANHDFNIFFLSCLIFYSAMLSIGKALHIVFMAGKYEYGGLWNGN